MKMRDIRIGARNAGKLVEYRLVPLMICSAKIGEELSQAALTRGLAPGSDLDSISSIDLNIAEGECVLICGESGCGKSTLMFSFLMSQHLIWIRMGLKCWDKFFVCGNPRGIRFWKSLGFVENGKDEYDMLLLIKK